MMKTTIFLFVALIIGFLLLLGFQEAKYKNGIEIVKDTCIDALNEVASVATGSLSVEPNSKEFLTGIEANAKSEPLKVDAGKP